ncbi:MAG: VanZ family protein [Pyrinomonadaceae bacterium]
MIVAEALHERRKRIVRYAPLIIWISVIFFLSSGEASMSHTSYFVEPVLRFFYPDITDVTLQIYHGYVRKAAHLTEYAALGFLASRVFYSSSHAFLRNRWFAVAAVAVLIVASLDEFNQSFEPSRTSSTRDVLIDLAGGVTATVLYWMWHARSRTSGNEGIIRR